MLADGLLARPRQPSAAISLCNIVENYPLVSSRAAGLWNSIARATLAVDKPELYNSGRVALLGVNIDHVATVRQARGADEPDPIWAAVEAELGGADAITFHLREDRRHVTDRDARLLRETVAVKLNMEMAIAEEIVTVAESLKPDQCTLVPERREERTTEGGLDVVRLRDRIARAVHRLREAGIKVSAFVEPSPDQVASSKEAGFHAVELWTGGYAHAHSSEARLAAVTALRRSIDVGLQLGLEVHAGHGLTYRNISAVAALQGLREFNIGHSIVSRAVFVGIRKAVKEMKHLLTVHAPNQAGSGTDNRIVG